MPCPDLGALRASLDDAADGTPAALRDHVHACAACRETLAELRRNAELAAPAIAMTAPPGPLPPAAVEDALARLEQRRARLLTARAAAEGAATTAKPHLAAVAAAPVVPLHALAAAGGARRRGRRFRLGGRARVAAAALIATVVMAGLVATPGGRAATASFLGQFRSERFEVVSLNTSQSMQIGNVMSQLVETGVFSGDESELYRMSEPATARDVAEASRLAGFTVQPVAREVLPRGVAAKPERILVTQAHTMSITFNRDRAIAYFKGQGRDVRLPGRFDGAKLLVRIPAIVLQEYPGRDDVPRLLVGQAGMISLDADGGASIDELRDVVLSLPGLPKETVEQLRNISDWRTTLPLPVPTDEVHFKKANVKGTEALSFADPTGKMHALLWQRGGHIWGVAGVVSANEAQHVADSLG